MPFEKISYATGVADTQDKQGAFRKWLVKSNKLDAEDMMTEYMTNIAFNAQCDSPPLFLLDVIQGLSKPTTVQLMLKNDQVVYHSFLSLLLILLTQLAGRHKPVCICT